MILRSGQRPVFVLVLACLVTDSALAVLAQNQSPSPVSISGSQGFEFVITDGISEYRTTGGKVFLPDICLVGEVGVRYDLAYTIRTDPGDSAGMAFRLATGCGCTSAVATGQSIGADQPLEVRLAVHYANPVFGMSKSLDMVVELEDGRQLHLQRTLRLFPHIAIASEGPLRAAAGDGGDIWIDSDDAGGAFEARIPLVVCATSPVRAREIASSVLIDGQRGDSRFGATLVWEDCQPIITDETGAANVHAQRGAVVVSGSMGKNTQLPVALQLNYQAENRDFRFPVYATLHRRGRIQALPGALLVAVNRPGRVQICRTDGRPFRLDRVEGADQELRITPAVESGARTSGPLSAAFDIVPGLRDAGSPPLRKDLQFIADDGEIVTVRVLLLNQVSGEPK